MSDADDQTGGSSDPRYQKLASSESEGTETHDASPTDQDEKDNDVMTDDDLPSGG